MLEEYVHQLENEGHGGVPWEREDNNAGVQVRRIVADICKIKIAGEQTELMRLCIRSNVGVFRVPKTNVTHIEGVMASPPKGLARDPREICVNKKSHGGSLRGGQRVVLFLFDQLARVGQSGLHIFFRHSVLVSNLLDSHPTGQSPNEPHNRDPRTTYDRLAMLHGGINANALSHFLSFQDGFLHRTEEMQKCQSKRKI